MTSNRRHHRLAALTAASVLFALTSTASALATQHAPASQPAPAAVVTNLSAGEDLPARASTVLHDRQVPVRAAVPVKQVVAKPATVTRPAAVVVKAKPATPARASVKATAPRTAPAKVISTPAHRTISSYVDAPGSQKAIDSCALVLWTHSPLWLAGHNWCGWAWMASVPNGTIVTVTKGAAAGTFVVTGHLRLGRQSGALPAVNADLVLQTCVGSGTGLTLLRRI